MKNKLNEKNRNVQTSQGITLVALVITIILLLILAGVAINMAINSDGLFAKANEAVEGWNSAVGEEENSISNLLTIAENIGKEEEKWVYDHATQTVRKGSLELKIGDYVEETARTVDGKTFDGKWRVLGEENGQLLLVSENFVDFEGSTGSAPYPYCSLEGADGWNNGVKKLNDIGAKFADGVKTEKGRSITVEDVNKITGYNPLEARMNQNDLTQKTPFASGGISQYGNNVTYTMKDGKVWYKGDQAVTEETESSNTKFWKIGENSNITEPFTVKSTFYTYYPETLGPFPGSAVAEGQTMEGISTDSAAYDMLFKLSGPPYWLASPCVDAFGGNAIWNLFYVNPYGYVNRSELWDSDNGSYSCGFGVRAAVSLKSNITPELKSTDSTTGISTYEI